MNKAVDKTEAKHNFRYDNSCSMENEILNNQYKQEKYSIPGIGNEQGKTYINIIIFIYQSLTLFI